MLSQKKLEKMNHRLQGITFEKPNSFSPEDVVNDAEIEANVHDELAESFDRKEDAEAECDEDENTESDTWRTLTQKNF